MIRAINQLGYLLRPCLANSIPVTFVGPDQHQSFQLASLAKIQYQQSRGVQWSPLYKDPVISEEDYKVREERGQLEDLTFSPIKAALMKQSCSVFKDSRLDKFIGLVVRKGKRYLARTLMEESFYEIKLIQMEKLNKLREKERKLEEEVKEEEKKGITKSAQHYDLEELRKQISCVVCNPIEIFHKALDNCTPIVETRPVRRGGATYQVPYPLTPYQAEFKAMKWTIEAVKERPKPRFKSFPYIMSRSLIESSNNEGKVVKKKQDIHRQADANKAYAHYRWG